MEAEFHGNHGFCLRLLSPFLCILGSLGADTGKTGPRGQQTSTVNPERSCSWPWCSLS